MSSSACYVCKKKLNFSQATIGKCKCEYTFCQKHIHDHQCSYNFKKDHQSQLHTSIKLVEFTKVESI